MPAGPDGRPPHPAAVVFDLEETLLDRRRAWRYTIEQAVSIVTGASVDARPLVDEYWRRPYAHAIDILVTDPADRRACQALCVQIYQRSAMKWLLVHEGIGTALNALVAAQVQVGAVSREPHPIARKQVESTGLDRFVTTLTSTPEGDAWDVLSCLAACIAFLECDPNEAVYITANNDDAAVATAAGWTHVHAGWAGPPGDGGTVNESARDLAAVLLMHWAQRDR